MKANIALMLVVFGASLAYGDAYSTLLHRYEKQIQQQEKQLGSLRTRLQEKGRDVNRWKNKAVEAKAAWTQASATLEDTRAKIRTVHEKRRQVRLEADAAQWKTAESVLLSRSAVTQARALAQDLYGQFLLSASAGHLTVEDSASEFVLPKVTKLSADSSQWAEASQREEAALRTEEMRFQTEEEARTEEVGLLHQKQESHWLRWQEALRRKNALEDEISQIDQSAKALQVMVQELRDHRDQARALRENRSANSEALASLRGTLPWPAHGKVVQNFGRQYLDGLTQLIVSNGIKIDAGQNHTVRAIQDGKVLFANAFHQYGRLVIVQHKNGLTSVYAGLGQTQVKEGQVLAALDQIGLTGDAGSFYFELRRDEEPINPLVYLTPSPSSELSLRRNFR